MRARLLLIMLLAFAGCTKAKKQEVAAEPEKERPPIDACSLLTSSEIESVQGEAVQETKPSNSSGGAFTAAQCYFALPTHTKSVVITVTQRGPGPAAKNPKEWWLQTFHRERAEEHEAEEEHEEAERKRPPEKIDGIGDEAFWAGNPVGGALYVLKGDLYFRISTGGGNQLERTKKLAQIAAGKL